jgi:tetratricopeptide (TPR) repeat protein
MGYPRWQISMILILISGSIFQVNGSAWPATQDATPAQQLLEQADEAFQRDNYGQAMELYKLTVQAAKEEMLTGIQGEALAQVARCYLKDGQMEEGRHWLKMAAEIVSDQMPRAWSRYLGVRGRFEWQSDELDRATQTFKEMYDYCLEHSLHERAVDAAHMVAITAPAEEQIAWARKGIAAAEEGQIEGWLGPLWNNLGWTYDDLGRYEESLDALLKAREYHWKRGSEMNKLIADWSVGHAYRTAGQPGEAVHWLRPVLAWSERLYDDEKSPDAAEWVGHSCRELGELALDRNEPAEALAYLQRAREMLAEAGMPEWDADGYEELTEQVDTLAKQLSEE